MTTNQIIQGRDFVIISSIDWSENWQIHQLLACSLVENGNRVLFIENTGARAVRMGDFSRISTRIRNWFNSTRGFCEVRKNLTVFTSLFLPFPYSRFVLSINRFLLSRAILRWIKINHFNTSVVFTFLPTPLAASLIKDINPSVTIYYCADNMAEGSPGSIKIRPFEDILLSEADAVFCTSNALLNRAKRHNSKSFLFPAGVDFKKFEMARLNAIKPADLSKITTPIVGYVGAIRAFFDQRLIVLAAKAFPDVTFILVGPVTTDVSQLSSCSNIKLLGKRPHDDLPAYIKNFNVALIPFVKNSYTDAVYSCKLNEYLSMGIPVVATDMQELTLYAKENGQVLEIAKNDDEFIFQIRRGLLKSSKAKTLLRIASARENSWEKRFLGISQVVNEMLLTKNNASLDWKANLLGYYRRGRIKIIKSLIFFIICYGLIFLTPFGWLAGSYLAVQQPPMVSDAIVVFSGDGEAGYVNQSYQRRTLDAINYYKAGYAPIIILSSGKYQAFSEVEIMKSLLIDRGVPEGSIHIVGKYPRSTYENVILVKEKLIKFRVKSILLITSPYHSRRAILVWKKAMPNLFLIAPEVIDTPKTSTQWGASMNQIKVIFYEYAAISYYWWKDWL